MLSLRSKILNLRECDQELSLAQSYFRWKEFAADVTLRKGII